MDNPIKFMTITLSDDSQQVDVEYLANGLYEGLTASNYLKLARIINKTIKEGYDD